MTHRHKLIGIREDLLDVATKFRTAERLSFGEDTIAVCIKAEHMDTIVGILKSDAKVLGEIAEGM